MPRHETRHSPAAVVFAAATFGLTALAMLALVVPIRSGVLGLALIFELQLFGLALIAGVPVAIVHRSRLLAVALAIAVVVAAGRFGPELVSATTPTGADLTVATWNLERGARTGEEAVRDLVALRADVIALQEVEPRIAAAIEADPTLTTRYPYRSLIPREDTRGLAILSNQPIAQTRALADPALVEVRLSAGGGDVTLIDAHPLPLLLGPDVDLLAIPFNASARDADLARIREVVDAALSRGDRVLLVGDFNTAPSEAGYQILSRGLEDAHVEVGSGPGWTWRPALLDFLPAAFLRIDYQFSGGAIEPRSTWTDCSHRGDHCQLQAGYRLASGYDSSPWANECAALGSARRPAPRPDARSGAATVAAERPIRTAPSRSRSGRTRSGRRPSPPPRRNAPAP